jgi:hypothetical protein
MSKRKIPATLDGLKGAPFVDQAMSNLDGFSRVNRDKAVNIERIKVSISVTMIPIRPKT